MTVRRASLLALLLGVLHPLAAQGQSFNDFGAIGRLEDSRREASPLTVGGHSFEPRINYKLLGITTPHVFAAARGGWTDNYLFQDADAPGVALRSELFGQLFAGARLDTQLSDHRLELGYRAAATELVDSGDLDTLEQEARARLDLLGNHVEGHVDASWIQLAYPQSIQLTGIVRSQRYGGSAWAEGRVGEAGARVGGSAFLLEYRDSELSELDSQTLGADLQLYARVQPKLRALVEYNWSMVSYDAGRDGSLNDYMVHRVSAGLDGDLSPKLSASLKAGWSFQEADDGPGSDDRDLHGFSASLSGRWSPVEGTSITLVYSRSIQPSTNSNGLFVDDVRGEFSQAVASDVVTFTAGFGYSHAVVLPGQHLNRLLGNASVEVKLTSWVSLVADYQFSKLNSAFPDSDYLAHAVGVSIGMGL
jgi:hypothetical protein